MNLESNNLYFLTTDFVRSSVDVVRVSLKSVAVYRRIKRGFFHPWKKRRVVSDLLNATPFSQTAFSSKLLRGGKISTSFFFFFFFFFSLEILLSSIPKIRARNKTCGRSSLISLGSLVEISSLWYTLRKLFVSSGPGGKVQRWAIRIHVYFQIDRMFSGPWHVSWSCRVSEGRVQCRHTRGNIWIGTACFQKFRERHHPILVPVHLLQQYIYVYFFFFNLQREIKSKQRRLFWDK